MLSVETFTLMKTCCTFLARPEVCQVRREVSLCPLGSKIGHKCKILSKLETFQRATQKCLVSSRNGHFMRRGHWKRFKSFPWVSVKFVRPEQTFQACNANATPSYILRYVFLPQPPNIEHLNMNHFFCKEKVIFKVD